MAEQLYTPAEIWRAKALGCQPEQLLPRGKTCGDCIQRGACAAILGPAWCATNRCCDWSPSRFLDSWRPRAA